MFLQTISFSLQKTLTDGLEWCGLLVDYVFLSAVWTLILTAPIHCRASIAEQVMWCYISPNLEWAEGKEINIFTWNKKAYIQHFSLVLVSYVQANESKTWWKHRGSGSLYKDRDQSFPELWNIRYHAQSTPFQEVKTKHFISQKNN